MVALLDAPECSSWALAGIALLRRVTLLACLATGWFGGEIFPAAVLGMAAARAVAAPFGSIRPPRRRPPVRGTHRRTDEFRARPSFH
jgi:H+/Cl- antiporter ClcA